MIPQDLDAHDVASLTTDAGVRELYRRARTVAHFKYHVRYDDQEDAAAEAVCAVLAARDRYDPAGCSVWTFAHWKIVGAVSRWVKRRMRQDRAECVRIDAPGCDYLARSARDVAEDVTNGVLVEHLLGQVSPHYRELIARSYLRDETDNQIERALGFRHHGSPFMFDESARDARVRALVKMAHVDRTASEHGVTLTVARERLARSGLRCFKERERERAV